MPNKQLFWLIPYILLTSLFIITIHCQLSITWSHSSWMSEKFYSPFLKSLMKSIWIYTHLWNLFFDTSVLHGFSCKMTFNHPTFQFPENRSFAASTAFSAWSCHGCCGGSPRRSQQHHVNILLSNAYLQHSFLKSSKRSMIHWQINQVFCSPAFQKPTFV